MIVLFLSNGLVLGTWNRNFLCTGL